MPAARPQPTVPLPRLTPAHRQTLRVRLRAAIRTASLAELSPEKSSLRRDGETRPFWELEPVPLVLPAAEWAQLEAGLRQRARLANAFLFDAYGGQLVLRDGLLPPEIVLNDPYYRRACLDLEPERKRPAMLLCFDLVKTAAGWLVTGTHTNSPTGLGIAVQNRRFLSQEAGEIYRALPDHHSIVNFPLQLLDTLKQLAPRAAIDRAGGPAIVLLTAGPHDPFYAEHSFLARKMGLPLVQGDDLLVFDNRVYFKTIAGLEPVDVIYRRLNDAHIDPVVFSTDRETVGVPGLLQCIRRGGVTVANAIGSGLAESRALDAYLPRLTRFYLGEKPLLPGLPTYTCGDTDQLDFVLEASDAYRLRAVHDPRLGDPSLHQPEPALFGPRGLAREVRENPFGYVAQKILCPLPLQPGAKHSPPFRLSAYVLVQDQACLVMPGGLVRLGPDDPLPDRLGLTADALVLQNDPATGRENQAGDDRSAAPGEPAAPPTPLGSRTAENLFWLGRYLERAETTARMLSILDDVALEEIPARDRRRWLPVWQGLLEATGHAETQRMTLRTRPHEAFSPETARRMTLDAHHASSIYTSVRLAADNARRLRDHLSPEAWVLLPGLVASLDAARRKTLHPHPAAVEDITAKTVARVLVDLNAFLGTAERTMVHDAAWYFLRLGAHLERAIMTCSALRHALGAGAKPVADREAPELSALLRLLGSQDAYRRLYQAHSQPLFIADLLLRQGAAPRSLFHNLANILNRLRAIRGAQGGPTAAELAVEEMLSTLRTLNLDPFFADPAGEQASAAAPHTKTSPLGEFLAGLLARLNTVHPLLSDHYFSHQARVAPGAQGELSL